MRNHKLVLVFILILAFFLRRAALLGYPGYPPYHSDEGMSYSAAIEMVKNANWDPLRYDYPAVVPIVNKIAYKLVFIPASWTRFYFENSGRILEGFIKIPLDSTEYKKVFQTEILGEREINVLGWGRAVTSGFSVLVVLLVYLLAKEVFDKKVGLIAAFLTAINYRQVLNSQLGLPDVYNAFFLLLSLHFTFRLFVNSKPANYYWAAVFTGISVATKYQIYAPLALLLVHMALVWKQPNWQARLRWLTKKEALLVIPVVVLVFLIINPYHFIKFEETREWLVFVSSKYASGINELDLFGYSYLYHLGLGKLTTLVVIVGLIIGLVLRNWRFIWLVTIAFVFFYITTYYTQGGFYTRNFVTITPLLLIFAGYGLSKLLAIRPRPLGFVLLSLVLVPVATENLVNSLVVPSEYKSQWNFEVIRDWTAKNIPVSSKIAAHSSVVLPQDLYVRLPYDFHLDFSLDEFASSGADFAVANLDWATNEFYWWMTARIGDLTYWEKPIDEMEEMYSALALGEISSYAIFSQVNKWQAPDSNFMIAKIPKFEVVQKTTKAVYELSDQTSWKPVSKGDGFKHEQGSLVIQRNESKSPYWVNEPVTVSGWEGVSVDYVAKSTAQNPNYFVFIKFYASEEDATNSRNRLGVRISGRANNSEWQDSSLASPIPPNANFMTVGVQVYNSSDGVSYLDRIIVNDAKVNVDLGGWEAAPVKLDPNVLYPNSHGYL